MTVTEIVTISGFVLTILTMIGGFAFMHGRGEQWRSQTSEALAEIREQLNRDGGMGFVRRREIQLLKEQADREHEIINDRLRVIGDRTHQHTEMLARHATEIETLKEGA